VGGEIESVSVCVCGATGGRAVEGGTWKMRRDMAERTRRGTRDTIRGSSGE
jgi:hypothetical protein